MDCSTLVLPFVFSNRVKVGGDDGVVDELGGALEHAHRTQLQLQRAAVLGLFRASVSRTRKAFNSSIIERLNGRPLHVKTALISGQSREYFTTTQKYCQMLP